MPRSVPETGPYDGGKIETQPPTYGFVATTGASTVEGQSKFTIQVPRTGLYRVTAYVTVINAGTGAGQAVAPRIAYTNGDGVAIAAANILPYVGAAAPTAIDLTAAPGAAGSMIVREQTVHAYVGSLLVLDLLGSGTFTTGAVIKLWVAFEIL